MHSDFVALSNVGWMFTCDAKTSGADDRSGFNVKVEGIVFGTTSRLFTFEMKVAVMSGVVHGSAPDSDARSCPDVIDACAHCFASFSSFNCLSITSGFMGEVWNIRSPIGIVGAYDGDDEISIGLIDSSIICWCLLALTARISCLVLNDSLQKKCRNILIVSTRNMSTTRK